MDAFKLLTRSTKLKTGPASRKQAISNSLPSAGAAETPQLFCGEHGLDASEPHDEKFDTKGRKRKRGADVNEFSAGATPVALDFFGSGSASCGSSGGDAKLPKQKPTEDDGKQGDVADEIITKEASLTEEERKAILSAHKIKITDLRTPAPAISQDERKLKKKKKKQKIEEIPMVLSRKQQRKAQRMYPQPLVSFQQLKMRYRISRRLEENILSQGYSVPTEVQLGALPLLFGDCQSSAARLQEHRIQPVRSELEPDLLVVAPTGSGKTLAFMIPLISKIMRHHHQGGSQTRELFAIILAPTKELVSQIVNEGRKLTAGTGVKITAMRKGMRVVEDMEGVEEAPSDGESDISEDDETTNAKQRRRNVPITRSDILVSTPLLLANSLSNNQKHATAPLPTIQSLVLDEADVLLDPLFRDQTLNVWRACTNAQLRIGLWSATMGSNIEELAKLTVSERQQSLGLRDDSFLVRLVVGLKDTAIPNISHKLVYAATEQGKLLGLRQLLHPKGASSNSDTHLRPPFLVFTQTISRAVALHSELKYDIPAEAGGSSRIAVLHSELSDSQRLDIMAGFRKGEIWILITTDLLSRGVDFRGINGVVNYDIPNSSAAYVHRVGRTGRAGREGGVAVTFYTKEDIPYVKNIANVIAASEKLRGVVGDKGVQKWLLDALPNLSKKAKKDLKQHGVEVRRPMTKKGKQEDKDRRRTRISTKSGFERRKEHNRRDAVKASQRRKYEGQVGGEGNAYDNESWDGIEA
ncbi:hypothetical protein AJ78_00452 [Emergomyces pasteurianus Ep9510]|uniref:ATP-dependent RNA helicase ROK1 n=1 Tax=Emergomyces pasteurianus Ep9510 TaxID=1447872 RepID=A0A1J9QHB7_9EURO|nr:hypothetical protein AJ78_00452 [Emergomyces pasteurianus Ep9510]